MAAKKEQDKINGMSDWAAVVLFFRGTVSQSWFALARPIQQNGPYVGAGIIVVISFVACHAMRLFGDVCLETHATSYDGVIGSILGPKARRVAACLFVFRQFCTLCLNLVFSGETLSAALSSPKLASKCVLLVAMLLTPAIFIRSVDVLKYVASYSFVLFMGFALGILANALISPAADPAWGAPVMNNVVRETCLMIQASTVSSIVAPVTAALCGNEQIRLHRQLRIAFLFQVAAILMIGVAGVWGHGANVPTNYLLGIPEGVLAAIARLAFVANAWVSMVVGLFNLQLSLPTVLRMAWPTIPERLPAPLYHYCGSLVIIVAAACAIGVHSDIGSLMAYQGALLATPIDFVLPMICVLAIDSSGVAGKLSALCIIVGGVFNALVRIVGSG